MGQLVGKRKELALEEVKAAIAFDQPKLHARKDDRTIHVEGSYLVFERNVVAAPGGPITAFDIRMELPVHYPCFEPKVFETGGRIPREPDRHINPDGDCCITVWEHWLATAADQSIAGYINGPLHEYFLGQFWFEKTAHIAPNHMLRVPDPNVMIARECEPLPVEQAFRATARALDEHTVEIRFQIAADSPAR